MPEDRMTPRERWLAVLNHDVPDRVPLDYWSTGEATQKLMAHLGCKTQEEMFARLHIDQVVFVGGRYVGPPAPEGEDIFGRKHQNIDYGTGQYGECVHHPLARYNTVEEIEADYKWPSPDSWDYSDLAEEIRGKEHLPIRGGGSEPFLAYQSLRGMEQAFIDLVDKPEMVHYCLDKLFDLAYENTRRIYEQIPGKVLFSYVAEDLGTQESLLMSLDQIRTFLLPRMKRMMDLVHSADAFVFHHNDGAVRTVIPDLIETGIDILNPIQWRCRGMNREELDNEFGDQIVFHGAMDNQYTLAFGTIEEVEQEVFDNLRILGGAGGYILAPCHNIQPVSPPENIVAMYDAAYENGWY